MTESTVKTGVRELFVIMRSSLLPSYSLFTDMNDLAWGKAY